MLKFPAIGKWKNGNEIIDVTFDFCDSNSKKRRKGDFVAKAIMEIFEKFGNVSSVCPIKKVSKSIINALNTKSYL